MISINELKPLQALASSVLLRERRLMLMLPRQEGKTELGVRCIRSILDSKKSRSCLFLAKDKASGKRMAAEKYARLFDSKTFSLNTEKVYRKDNEASICYFQSVDKDPDRMRGGTYFFIHWSEVAFSKLELGVTVQDIVDLILKPTMRVTDGFCLLESTPNGQNGWSEIWHDAEQLGFKKLAISLSQMCDMGLVEQSVYDKIKNENRPDVFDQEYECKFVSFAGKTYSELKDKIHINENIPPPEHWQMVVGGIDWGYFPHCTCVLFAYIRDGIICVFDEIYGQKMLIEKVYDHIIDKIDQYSINKFAAVADHEPRSVDELNQRGIPCSNASKVNVLGARLQIKELLFKNKLFIHPRCKMLLRDLKACEWDAKKYGEINYSLCTWGHFDAEAALRYLIREYNGFESSRPTVLKQIENSVSAAAWRMESQTKNMRLQNGYD